MNWTGGGLSRSRFAKGTLTAKQKNYFAKARGKLQHGRPPPPEIQFFEFGEWMPERKAVDFSPHHTRKDGSSPMQRTLDQFENTKPLARRLEGLKPRQEPRKRKCTPLAETGNQARRQSPKSRTAEPIIIGSSPSSSGSSNNSPPARRPPPHSSSSEDILNAPSIETKRRRLLEMNDWVGVDHLAMKPVKMKFADPADTDLIGRRRRITKINYRHPSDRRRPVARPDIHVKRPREIPKAEDQYYPGTDISVRIGSAVDRSNGRVSVKDNSRLSVLSDELLDGEFPRLAYEPPPSVPAFNTPGPAPMRLSDHGYREILTPSAFMDDSSSASKASERIDRLERYEQASSPARRVDMHRSNGIDELREWVLPPNEQEQAQEEPTYRLVFEDTPRPHAGRVQGRGSSPILQDFAVPEPQIPKYALELATASSAFDKVPWDRVGIRNIRNPSYAERDSVNGNTDLRAEGLADVFPQLVSAASENAVSGNVDNDLIHSDPKVETLAITTPPSAMASAQVLTEFQSRIASNATLEDGITRTLQDMEKRFARETGKVLPPTSRRKDHQAIDRLGRLQQDHLQNAREAKGSMRDPTRPYPAEGKTSLLQAPPQAATTTRAQQRPAEPSVTTNCDSQMSLPATKEKEALKVAEDEEAAWRKIVFGDGQGSNHYTFEEPEASSQGPSSPNHPRLTQPSLLAEAATSPLKQNPHLADSTFEGSNSPVAFRSPTQTYTNNSDAKDSTSSSPPLQPPTFTDPPTPSQPRLPRTLVQNPINSSLLGEAGSAYQQILSVGNLSSDELHWPPERLPGFSDSSRGHSQNQESRGLGRNQRQQTSGTQIRGHGGNLQKEKVVFKKPTRYVGSHSSDAGDFVVLGERVLRSGRRVSDTRGKNGKGAKGKRKGRGKEKGGRREWEQSEDDIVDD